MCTLDYGIDNKKYSQQDYEFLIKLLILMIGKLKIKINYENYKYNSI